MTTYYSWGKYKYEWNAAGGIIDDLCHVQDRWFNKPISRRTRWVFLETWSNCSLLGCSELLTLLQDC